jgi:PIN domain nuclease of toxin-antitoxin system
LRVVADSHAIVWYVSGSDRISGVARDALREAERSEGVVLSVATLVDLWYVTQTTKRVTDTDLSALRSRLDSARSITWEPITVSIADDATSMSRAILPDPWDRFIVATARVLGVSLVTRDEAILSSQLVHTIW